MFHHDPLHTDEQLESLLKRAEALWEGDGAGPILAREGLELDLT
jgi:hypothetical protein